MNKAFLNILSAPVEERRGLFLATATRLDVPIQNIEKDFANRKTDKPRLLFKGGTSLSKAYGLISRFSEDLDITVFERILITTFPLKS